MSQALEDLLSGMLRVPTGTLTGREDPGVPISRDEVREAIAWLTDRQSAALKAEAIECLASSVESATDAERYRMPMQFDKSAEIVALKKLPADQRVDTYVAFMIVFTLLHARLGAYTHRAASNGRFTQWLHNALLVLGKLKMNFTPEHARVLLDCMRGESEDARTNPATHFAATPAMTALQQNREQMELDEPLRQSLTELRQHLHGMSWSPDSRKWGAMLDEMLGTEESPLWDAEPWAKGINESWTALEPSQRRAWAKVLAHAGTINPSKPGKPWLAEAGKLIEETNASDRNALLTKWLRCFIELPRAERPPNYATDPEGWRRWSKSAGREMANTAHIAGLVAIAGTHGDESCVALLGDVAEMVSRMKQEARVTNVCIANIAVRTLASNDSDAALAMLSRLEIRIRWPKLKKIVKKQLEEAIARRGLDRAEVEETLVPDFGLREGVAMIPFNGISAQLTLGRSDKPSVEWKSPDGKTARTLPAKLKPDNPGASEQIKQIVAEIEKMRAAQRTRLDLLMRRSRTWSFVNWRERYLDHGLVGSLARRLIWIINETPVVWRDGSLVTIDGDAITFPDDATVRAWHPASQSVEDVVAWRNALEAWEITQPFKQAYREVYLLTDAELRTETYSNRFAAHIVRAMTLLSISQVRQWKSGLYGGASSPSFELPDYGLRAEWWMQMAGSDYTPYGTPIYLASDQVRFVCTSDDSARSFGHTGGTEYPLRLDRVPMLAFSEIMRDVDLFVSLASVGNDPNWQDGGGDAQFRNYWHSFSFGELNESAKTRRAALERLVPRLSIKDRLSFRDKFLAVRGDLRTYKIHLGSGNILMEPNDQYLCIVPDSRAREDNRMFLPFEGDKTLSIIISKAFLLAADTKISDPTITRQIGRGG